MLRVYRFRTTGICTTQHNTEKLKNHHSSRHMCQNLQACVTGNTNCGNSCCKDLAAGRCTAQGAHAAPPICISTPAFDAMHTSRVMALVRACVRVCGLGGGGGGCHVKRLGRGGNPLGLFPLHRGHLVAGPELHLHRTPVRRFSGFPPLRSSTGPPVSD